MPVTASLNPAVQISQEIPVVWSTNARNVRHVICSLLGAQLCGKPMIKRRHLRSKAGFTFLEAITASGIMVLAIVSVLALIAQSFRYLSDIRLMARSSQVLQQKMEDIRLLSWTNMQSLSNNFSDANDTNHVYTGTITVNDY